MLPYQFFGIPSMLTFVILTLSVIGLSQTCYKKGTSYKKHTYSYFKDNVQSSMPVQAKHNEQ